MFPVLHSIITALSFTAIIIISATILAAITIRPAKAFAACAHLSSHDKELIFPSILGSLLFYSWFAAIIFSVIQSFNIGIPQIVLSYISIIPFIILILLPIAYLITWIRAMFLLDIEHDIRRGLPFFIVAAIIIEIMLLASLL